MAISLTSWVAAGAIALALGAVGVQTVRLANEQAAHANTKADFAGERVAAADENSRAQAEQRDEYERRELEKNHAIVDAQSKLAAKTVAVVRADRAAASLRDETAATVQRAREACKGAEPGPGGPPAEDPIGVLADVSGRLDRRAGVLAEYADAARIAGEACERSYDSLTP